MSQFNDGVFRIGLLSGGLVLFLILELAAPYRDRSVSKMRRWLNNIGFGILNYGLMQFAFIAILLNIANYVTQQQIGLVHFVTLPRWLKIVDTVILMDFFLYLWHVLLHRLPVLWRVHRVHHTDLDVDASSALRFHVIEVAASAIVRMGIVFFIGADPAGVLAFELIYLIADQFRHSGFKLPQTFESVFWILFVPPAMHRIHHSVDRGERHTNFGTIFSIWDRFFGTLRTGVNQRDLWYGVDGHIQEKKLDFHHLLVMPFNPPVK